MRTAAGRLALLLALGHAAFALQAKRVFLHLGPVPLLPTASRWHEIAAQVALGLSVFLGLLALRRSRRRDLAAIVALALAAPFVLDVFVTPLTRLVGLQAGRWIFVLATEAALVLLLRAGWGALAPVRLVPAGTSRWPGRLAALCAALLVALALGEGAARAAGLGERRYARPMLIVPGAERRVPLSEITLFRPLGESEEQTGLSGRWRPYLVLKGWYDRPAWSYFDASGCVDYVFNRYGLRDHDFELEKAEGEYRVLAIGDSFTFGIGVQLDDCWTEVLERGLAERQGRPVEVINAGFAAGFQPAHYESWLASDGIRLAPDVVAIGLCLNDLHVRVPLYAYEPPTWVTQPCGGCSALLNALQSAAAAPQGEPWKRPDYAQLVRDQPEQWKEVQDALSRTRALLAEQGIRLLVVPLPMVTGMGPDSPYAELLKMVSVFCEAEGIEHVDLVPRFEGQDERSLWVHPTDQHPNDRGHRLIAEGVLDYLSPP